LGELSRNLQIYHKIQNINGLNQKKSSKIFIEKECGDLFFAFTCLANSLGINLEAALLNTLKKYKSR